MRRKFLVSGLAVMALSSGGTLTAVALAGFASSGGTISVAYENYGHEHHYQYAHAEGEGRVPGQVPGLEHQPRAHHRTRERLLHQARPHEQLRVDCAGRPVRGHLPGQQRRRRRLPGPAGLVPVQVVRIGNSSLRQPRPPPRATTARPTACPWAPTPVGSSTTRWCSPRPASRPVAPEDLGRRARSRRDRSRPLSRALRPMNIYSAWAPARAKVPPCRASRCSFTGPTTRCRTATTTKWEKAGAGFQAALDEYKQIYTPGPCARPSNRPRTTTWQTGG